MALLLLSFIAGVLTILAPCVLPLLPVIIGGSVSKSNKYAPHIITASLGGSIIVFTLILKATTLLIDIPTSTWAVISGIIIIIFGVFTLFPKVWEWIEIKLNLNTSSSKLLNQSAAKEGVWGNIAVGAALGPVFASCSPTYALVLASVLPNNFFVGLINIIVYSIGLSLVMLLVAKSGQHFVQKAKWLADPNGTFKKVMGIIFILVGLAVSFQLDKKFETYLVNNDLFIDTITWEVELQERFGIEL